MTKIINIDELTIDKVHEAYRREEYTCYELLRAYDQRIAELDNEGPKLRAITVISEHFLDEAQDRDRHFRETGEFVGSLHGIPVIVKDQCDTKGVQTAYGNKCCRHTPTEDATLVRKLREAGAVIFAKSSMPDFAASFNSASSNAGSEANDITLNPYDTSRETGGSSAGTGAAIAANYGLIGVGEDTGGSIRVPASFCNLVGLRPTVGLVSRAGLSPLVKTQDTPGPMTRTVRDAALMLDVLVGYDPQDPHTRAALTAGPPRGESYASNLSVEALKTARIGVLRSAFGEDAECLSVNELIDASLLKIKDTGATVFDIVIPNIEQDVEDSSTYMSRSRYDINNFLTHHPVLEGVTFESIYEEGEYHESLPLLRKMGEPGAFTNPDDDPSYPRRLVVRENLQCTVIVFMAKNNLDAIAYPSVKVPAPLVSDVRGTKFNKKFPTNTNIASQLHHPAITIPVGFTKDTNLPVGLEFMGVPYTEQKLLELAYGVETFIKGRRPPVFPDVDMDSPTGSVTGSLSLASESDDETVMQETDQNDYENMASDLSEIDLESAMGDVSEGTEDEDERMMADSRPGKAERPASVMSF